MSKGGRFDFDDGGTYCGGWEDGKAHGNGVCTGPKGQGEYAGAWLFGFEACGVYTWPSGNNFEGQWMQGKRHGLGVEKKGAWVYRGEWTQGFKGRYGVRESSNSGAKYEGTWTTGLQDGYGVETYADGDLSQFEQLKINAGTYQGQWLRGMRHGYGVRQSVPYGLASHYKPKNTRGSLTSIRSAIDDENAGKDRDKKIDEGRGGFVLRAKGDVPLDLTINFDKPAPKSLRKSLLSGLKLRKQKSTGDINEGTRKTGSVRSTHSNASYMSEVSAISATSANTDSNLSFVSQDDINDVNVTETYMGEWKNDKRCGFGICERTDGLKYEGEWFNNKKFGYGITTFKDGSIEEGKYKNNVLVTSGVKSKLFPLRASKVRNRVDNAVTAAQRAAQIAHQKADIAASRMSNARSKAEAADVSAEASRSEAVIARIKAKEFAPEFHQPGSDWANIPNGPQAIPGKLPTIQASPAPIANHAPIIAAESALMNSSNEPHIEPRKKEPSLERNHVESLPPLRQSIESLKSPPRDLPSTDRFSSLFNPVTVSDHFDQYKIKETPSRPSSRYRNSTSPASSYRYSPARTDSKSNIPNNLHAIPSEQSLIHPPSISSSISDTKSSQMKRRQTLPSIMAGHPMEKNLTKAPAIISETVAPSGKPPSMDTNRYVIESGVRKRVNAEVFQRPTKPSDPINRPKELSSKYNIETPSKLSKSANLGSMPDISGCKELQHKILPRSEVSKLSEKRRAELRALAEEEELRKQQEIVLRLGDIKDWCQQRQLLMLVIAVNVSLATMFFNLLSQ